MAGPAKWLSLGWQRGLQQISSLHPIRFETNSFTPFKNEIQITFTRIFLKHTFPYTFYEFRIYMKMIF